MRRCAKKRKTKKKKKNEKRKTKNIRFPYINTRALQSTTNREVIELKSLINAHHWNCFFFETQTR